MRTGPTNRTALNRMPTGKKLVLLLCNLIPLCHVAALVVLGWLLRGSPWTAGAAVLAALYLPPPLVARLALIVLPIRRTRIPVGSRDFFVWWFTLNLQVLFCRFPALEELLRIVPSCYSFWLRLWGAKIGKLTYWSAGTIVLDRPWLQVGDHVVFGVGVRMVPHTFLPEAQGETPLLLATITIGDRVTVGAYSLLGPAARIESDQCTRALLVLAPFNRLEEGRRVKPEPSAVGKGTGDDDHDL